MEFRTAFDITEINNPDRPINYQSKILLIGSCFVNNIGEKFSYYKFQNYVNPFGILFHPIAIERLFKDIVQNRIYSKEDLVYDNDLWHSLHHHSDFSDSHVFSILKKINTNISKTSDYIKNASHLIITLGTAWVYQHLDTKQFVANCHKIPQKQFTKRLLSLEEITKSLQNTIVLAKELNPTIQIILTLSPVRHLKDGIIANKRSKALLLTAIHQVVEDLGLFYFPAYEIMIDDLRDYRFYKSDMLHPNALAVNYIWNIFKTVGITVASFPIMKEVAQIQKGHKHKAFNPESKKHRVFIEKLEEKKTMLYQKHGLLF